MDDESILAGLDRDPDAFARFYRRHAAGLLDHFLSRTNNRRLAAELCAETFAAALDEAHRFNPKRGSADLWLHGIARRLLDDAWARGAAEGRARRRLGLAELAPGDRFLDELEEELVEAARFRAARRSRRRPLPRPPLRALLGAAAVLAAAAGAALALSGGDDERAAPGRPVDPSPIGQTQAYLLPMLPLRSCEPPSKESLSTGGLAADVALLRRTRTDSDAISFEPSRLPIAGFDARATRRAAPLSSLLHVVPSSHVAVDGRCRSDSGPGACLVASEQEFRCFTDAEVRGGRAVARTSTGTLLGLVPDGVDHVTVHDVGTRFGVEVAGNVYEAQVGDVPARQILLSFHQPGEGCRREVTPALLARVPVLRETAQPGLPLPREAIDTLSEWGPRIAAIVDDRARFWGGDERVAFWAVPVVTGGGGCAPANRACVVALAPSGDSGAACGLRARDVGGEAWQVAQLRPAHAVIYGLVPAEVIWASVTVDGSTGRAEAGNGVIGEVLPFPYRNDSKVRVDLVRGPVAPPTVGVVDATGIPRGGENKRAVIRAAGYPTVAAPIGAPAPVSRTVVYWRPTGTSRHEAGLVARLLQAGLRRVDSERSPGWVAEIPTPVVVVVGSEP